MGNFEEGAEGAAAGENPFLQACSQMFKDFENVSKEGNNNQEGGNSSEGDGEDPLMKMINDLAKGAMSDEGGNSDDAMQKIME